MDIIWYIFKNIIGIRDISSNVSEFLKILLIQITTNPEKHSYAANYMKLQG